MKKMFLLTVEDWNEDALDDNAWVELITSSFAGGDIDVEVYPPRPVVALNMTNAEMKKLLETALGVEIDEERAAWILAGVEDKLRRGAADQADAGVAPNRV